MVPCDIFGPFVCFFGFSWLLVGFVVICGSLWLLVLIYVLVLTNVNIKIQRRQKT